MLPLSSAGGWRADAARPSPPVAGAHRLPHLGAAGARTQASEHSRCAAATTRCARATTHRGCRHAEATTAARLIGANVSARRMRPWPGRPKVSGVLRTRTVIQKCLCVAQLLRGRHCHWRRKTARGQPQADLGRRQNQTQRSPSPCPTSVAVGGKSRLRPPAYPLLWKLSPFNLPPKDPPLSALLSF